MINNSHVNIKKSEIILKRIDTFNCQYPSNKTISTTESILVIHSKGVAARSDVKFEEVLDIPRNTLISNGRYCSVFQISYEIIFIAKPEFSRYKSPTLSVPIVMGTKALRVDARMFSSVNMKTSVAVGHR